MEWSWKAYEALSLDELYALLQLRQEVFCVEQECAYQDVDGMDAQAHHLLGWRDGVLVAYLRAFPAGVVYPQDICIGRVVTSPVARGTGLGRPLMRAGMARCWETYGAGSIKLSAQAHLSAYYNSLGFGVVGEGYLEDGIPHVPMRCTAP